MKLFKIFALFLALLVTSSCAFLFNDKNVAVSISSQPSGADVIIEGRNYGKTPVTINIEPKNYIATISKEGYGSTTLKLETWQAVREKSGDGGRCFADAIGTMLVLPAFSFWSVYCREFKQSGYSVVIPNSAGYGAPIRNPSMPSYNPYQGYYQQPRGF